MGEYARKEGCVDPGIPEFTDEAERREGEGTSGERYEGEAGEAVAGKHGGQEMERHEMGTDVRMTDDRAYVAGGLHELPYQ